MLDEYGGTEGIVTLEDVLEELVGEIHDEHRQSDGHAFVQREDGSWLVDALLPVEQFRQAIGLAARLPGEGTGRFTTLSGFLQRTLGRLPEEGSRIEVDGWVFEVVDMDGHRVDKLIVSRKA